MIKRVVILVLILVVGIILIDEVILPQVAAALNMPSLDSWTGLEGFLRLLPFLALAVLIAAVIRGFFYSGKDDED